MAVKILVPDHIHSSDSSDCSFGQTLSAYRYIASVIAEAFYPKKRRLKRGSEVKLGKVSSC